MFSSLTQLFKQNQSNHSNNANNSFKNIDLPKITFDINKKMNYNFGSNLINGYNLDIKQIINNHGNFSIPEDFKNLNKSSIRLDDKKTYRQLLNQHNNQPVNDKKLKSSLTANLLSINKSNKSDFNFLFRKNDVLLKKDWFNSFENKSINKDKLFFFNADYSFNTFSNFTKIDNKLNLIENLKKLNNQDKKVKEEGVINLENYLNTIVENKSATNKNYENDVMEYDEDHFANISKGTSSVCISETWEDIRDVEMDIDLPEKVQIYKDLSKNSKFLLDKEFINSIAQNLEKQEEETNRVLKEKENKCKEIKENTRLMIQEIESTNKDRLLKSNSITKMKYYPPCYDIEREDQEDKISDFEYTSESDLSDLDDVAEDDEEIRITEEITNKVNKVMSICNMEEEITCKYNCEIRRKDLETLSHLNWLNDEVINFYFNMIAERSRNKVYCFNTFFYSKLKDSGYKTLKRWTKKVDIFSYKLILIPVHLGVHWTLASIDTQKKEIVYYDSMKGKNYECLKLLLHYLKDELMDKKQQQLDTENWNLVIAKGIPQQMNGSDCGMFTCKYADYLSRDKSFTFTQNSMPFFRTRMIFEIVTGCLLNK